jgi:polyhydroxybutyrate depolymerase
MLTRTAARHGWTAVLAGALLLAAGACGADPPSPSPGSPSVPSKGTLTVKVGNRPFTLHVPDLYDPAKPAPLVILLHGYTASGARQEAYLKFTPESDRRGFLYAYPDGTVDSRSNRFWNATDACCDLYGSTVDDSTYLSDVIRKIQDMYRVDAKRVYLVGHSNGAFMAFRMACDHADQVTAIVALNGATWQDVSKCKPSGPVSVLDIRGTADQTIRYAGGQILNHAYPSAARTDGDWLASDHCAKAGAAAPALDLVTDLPGAETSVKRYTSGCTDGSTVETWTVKDGVHIPAFGPTFAATVMEFLLARTKA